VIVLTSLGGAEIRSDATRLTPSQVVVFAATLYIIVERRSPISRNRLSLLLWPNISPPLRAHRLRQTLYQLKHVGIPISADRDFVRLGRNAATVDFEQIPGSAPNLLINADSAEFLPGYDPPLSDQFTYWLDAVREKVHADLTRHVLGHLRQARTAGQWEGVERLSRVCLSLDPYNEGAILARAEAFAMRGQKAAAISILDNYSKDLGSSSPGLELPATILRRRVLQRDDQRSPPSSATKEPDFVGRQAEMAVLTQTMEDARKGNGHGCLVEGEPGIGKSRLASELAAFAELQGLKVERVSCKRSEADQPLSAFVTLVPRLRELPGALGCSLRTISWLKRLTEFDASSPEMAPPGEDSTTLYTNLRSAIFDLLDAVSEERCLLIIVEDIQWLDQASANLFASILEWLPSKKILVLFNTRELGNALTKVVSSQRLIVLRLSPLGSADARTLVNTMFAGRANTDGSLDLGWLIETADGNPYFLQELAKQSIESGQKRDVPPSIGNVLDERLSRLSRLALPLLQASAVLAEHCNLARLSQMFEYPPQDLLSGVQELSQMGMLRAGPGTGDRSQGLLVRHDLLSIAVLKTLAPASLAFLHRRCGTVLEAEALGDANSISLMRACAFHWYQAGDSDRAFDLAIKCANYLLEIGLATDAAVAFEGALGFCASAKREVEVWSRIIHANWMAGDRPTLLASIKRLRTLEESSGKNAHHDDIEIVEFEALRTTERDLQAISTRTDLCVFDRSLSSPHRVKAAVAAVKIASALADMEKTERIYREIEPILSQPSVDTSARLQIQVIYHTMCGDLSHGLAFARQRLAFERAQGLTLPLLNAMTDLAFVLRRTGPLEEQLSILREAYEISIEHNHYFMARDCAQKIASLMLENDELAGSREWVERAIEKETVANEIHGSFSFNAASARTALCEGRFKDVRKVLESGFDWDWLRDRPMWLAVGLALRIRLALLEKANSEDVVSDIESLGAIYESIARLGCQDYEVGALVLGLNYVGKGTQAKRYLKHFLSVRRDVTPVSAEIAQLVEKLSVTLGGSYSTAKEESPGVRLGCGG
jgi:DNA-binding SARP family transcriptional activator